jgi:hypothetical protein
VLEVQSFHSEALVVVVVGFTVVVLEVQSLHWEALVVVVC